MGLTSDLQDIVSDIFSGALDDIPVSITYIVKSQSYDTATGVVATTETEYSVDAVRYKFDSSQVNNISVFDNDQRLLIAGKDLSPTPQQNDIVILDSVRWEVVNVKSDPVRAHWDIQIRKP